MRRKLWVGLIVVGFSGLGLGSTPRFHEAAARRFAMNPVGLLLLFREVDQAEPVLQ